MYQRVSHDSAQISGQTRSGVRRGLMMYQWNSDVEGHGHIRKSAWAVPGSREEIYRATVFDQQEWAFELSHGLRRPVVPAKRARPGLGAFSQLPAQPVL